MCTTLKMVAYQGECYNISILSRKLQAHVKLVFKYFTIKAGKKQPFDIKVTKKNCHHMNYKQLTSNQHHQV